MGTSKFGGKYAVFVARFGCPITTPNLLHFGLKFLFWKLSEDVRTRCCQRIWTTLHNQKPKYAIEQKKRPLRVTPIMDKKKCSYGFPGIYTDKHHGNWHQKTSKGCLWARCKLCDRCSNCSVGNVCCTCCTVRCTPWSLISPMKKIMVVGVVFTNLMISGKTTTTTTTTTTKQQSRMNVNYI